MGKVKQWQVDIAKGRFETPESRIKRKLGSRNLYVIDVWPGVGLVHMETPGFTSTQVVSTDIAWFWGPGRWTRLEKFVDELLLKMRENKE